MSLSDHLRRIFKDFLDSMGNALIKAGLSPNAITLIALFGNLIAAVIISFGQIILGGFIVLLVGPLDAVDGAMARLLNQLTPFGAFLDSMSDRYSELAILGGLLIYFIRIQNWQACLLVYFAAIGSVLVSYARAKGESLGYAVKSGILTRVERYLIMAPSLILNVPLIGLWVIAVLGNITAFQRIYQVWLQSNQSARTNYSQKNLERK
jgi:CDP-diacylglycerol---glycerol-3-phosphate 3-phosphatidyltransferase